MRRLGGGLALVFAVAALTLAAVGAGAATGAVSFSVAEKGGVGPLGCGQASPPFGFAAARGNGVSSGRDPEAQYLLDMRARVRPLPGAGGGEMTIFGEVGGEPGATLTLRRERENGRWTLRWSSIDLVDGTRTGEVATAGSHLTTSNYIPFGTVSPGANRIRFRVECLGAGPIATVEVLGSTALRETRRAPAHLRLTTPSANRDPEVGTALPVPFEIVNTGDVPAVAVEVQLLSKSSAAQVVGRTRYLYSRLSGREEGEFLVLPRRPGPIDVEVVAASGNSNQPAVSLRGVAGRPAAGGGEVDSPWLAVAGLTFLAAVAVALARRRRWGAGA